MTDLQRYAAPTRLDEALDCLRDDPEVTILAGGTDLMPQSRSGRKPLRGTMLNIRRIPELKGISLQDGYLRICALCTITELMNDPLIREHLPVLAETGDHFASDQIRNAGTVGGNICNASPAGDTLVPLIVLDAEVELVSKPNGSLVPRHMPLARYVLGPGKTAREQGELLVALRVRRPAPGHIARFFKFGGRPALDISTISIGLAGVLEHGALHDVRVVFGAVGPTPLRAPASEAVLEGRTLDEDTIAAAAEAARDEVTPIDDIRASAWYRRELIHNMTKRMLDHVAQA